MQNIANQAHTAAEKVIAHMGVPTDIAGCARVAAACDGHDPDGKEGQFYCERFIGHCVNVSCGTAGV
jgi:hypothetical protein